jgi:DNA gyrase subunit B
LEEFFNKNKTFARQLIKQAVEISGARSELRKKISLVKKASKSKTGVLPGKLLEASPGIEPRKKELFLLEGDSAGGSAKNARFRHQEVLKLRGKFPNALRTLPSKLFENETISHILLSIGTGVGKDCDPEAMRVGKVLILTDPDKDGYHISSLLLTLFAEYMKPMVDAGKVYIVDAPLYTVTFRDKKYYANTLKELKKKLPKGADVSRMEVIRMKGWAEASAEDLKDLAFDKEKRVLYKVKKIEPNHKKMLVKIMGEDSAFRKLLLNI